MAIKSIEWLGFYEANAINVKSEWMRDEVIRIYKVPKEKITVVPADSATWLTDIVKLYSSVTGGPKNEMKDINSYDAQLGVSAKSNRRNIAARLLFI